MYSWGAAQTLTSPPKYFYGKLRYVMNYLFLAFMKAFYRNLGASISHLALSPKKVIFLKRSIKFNKFIMLYLYYAIWQLLAMCGY